MALPKILLQMMRAEIDDCVFLLIWVDPSERRDRVRRTDRRVDWPRCGHRSAAR